MFDPSRDQARTFFVESWRKRREHLPATAMETLAADLVATHPEYHALLEAPEAINRDFRPEDGQINPFLHLSLHLAIEEQLSIDQPPGLRGAFDALLARHQDRHAALHQVLECLGETLWRAQRDATQPDGVAYVACVCKRAGIAPRN